MPTPDSLFQTFTDLFNAITSTISNRLAQLGTDDLKLVNGSASQFSSDIVSQLQAAASGLAGQVEGDIGTALTKFFTLETTATQAALSNFTSILQSQAVEQLRALATLEFAKLQDILKNTAQVPTFTFTQNGQSEPASNVNVDLTGASGFGSDDFGPLATLLTGAEGGIGGTGPAATRLVCRHHQHQFDQVRGNAYRSAR